VPRAYTRLVTTPSAARSVRGDPRPFVSLLSDFGLRDPSAAICKGVVWGIAPDALVLDISHEVTKFHVRDGALLLWCALPYLPVGAHVAVVDPGVGTGRLAVAIQVARGDVLVGPDNGILIPGAERLGGIVAVHELTSSLYRLPVVTSTFHGRDLFAPAAAHLANGVPLEELGPSLAADALVRLDLPVPRFSEGTIDAVALFVDSFGNIALNLTRDDIEGVGVVPGTRLELELDDERYYAVAARTFADARTGDVILYEDSYRNMCVAISGGNAASLLHAEPGQNLQIRLADGLSG